MPRAPLPAVMAVLSGLLLSLLNVVVPAPAQAQQLAQPGAGWCGRQHRAGSDRAVRDDAVEP